MAIDMIGQRYGRLLVVERKGTNVDRIAVWLCHCDCGRKKKLPGKDLRNGRIMSCGCLRLLVHTRHGGYGTPEWEAWWGIKRRCLNPNHASFKNYGGRGIGVCDRWLNGDGIRTGFECFLSDVGRRPSCRYSIDRYPNNNGNYEPGNCRWATRKQQMANTRRSPQYRQSNLGTSQ